MYRLLVDCFRISTVSIYLHQSYTILYPTMSDTSDLRDIHRRLVSKRLGKCEIHRHTYRQLGTVNVLSDGPSKCSQGMSLAVMSNLHPAPRKCDQRDSEASFEELGKARKTSKFHVTRWTCPESSQKESDREFKGGVNWYSVPRYQPARHRSESRLAFKNVKFRHRARIYERKVLFTKQAGD